MNRSLEDVLVDILKETGRSPKLSATNRRIAATPSIKTEQNHWVWYCQISIPARVQGGMITYKGRGADPAAAATDCYRQILAADRTLWKESS